MQLLAAGVCVVASQLCKLRQAIQSDLFVSEVWHQSGSEATRPSIASHIVQVREARGEREVSARSWKVSAEARGWKGYCTGDTVMAAENPAQLLQRPAAGGYFRSGVCECVGGSFL